MKHITFLIGTFLCLSGSAQHWSWAKNILNEYSDYPQLVEANNNGDVFTCAVYEANSSYTYNIKTEKRSVAGQLLWTKNIGTSNNSYAFSRGLVADDSNLYVLGFFVHNLTFANTTISAGTWQLFIACYSGQDGTEKWIKAMPLYSDMANAMTIDNNGDIIITNFSAYPINVLTIKKISPAGNDIWTKNYNTNAVAVSIECDSQNNIYLAGSFGTGELKVDSTTYYHDTTFYDNGYIAKLETTGEIDGIEVTPGAHLQQIRIDANNNLFISGNYYMNGMAVRQTAVPPITPCGGNCSSYFIAKLQDDSCAWLRTAKGNAYNSFELSSNGEPYVGGTVSFDSTSSAVGVKIIKFTTNGTIQWVKANGGTYMASSFPTDIAYSENQSVYVTGAYQSNQFYLNTKVWFGTDTLPYTGYTTHSFLAKLSDDLTVSALDLTLNKNPSQLMVCPNPTSGVCRISYFTEERSNVQIQILDATGQVIWRETKIQCTGMVMKDLDLSLYAKGLYLIEILAENSKAIKKLIIE